MEHNKTEKQVECIVFDGFTRYSLTLLAGLNNPVVAVSNPTKARCLWYLARFAKVVTHKNKI